MNQETPVDLLIRSGSVRLRSGEPAALGRLQHQGGDLPQERAQLPRRPGAAVRPGGRTADDHGRRRRDPRKTRPGPGEDGSWCGSSAALWSLLQVWDLDSINVAELSGDSGQVEMEPVSELLLGHGVSLASVVRSPRPGSFLWFAQVRTRLSRPRGDVPRLSHLCRTVSPPL